MIRYVDTFKDRFGVEAICRILRATESGFVTARGYRAAKTRPLSARRLSDDLLGTEMVRLHKENYGVYGVRKMHALMLRQGWAIGRDQTARIMRRQGLVGVRRSKKVFTTKSDPAAARPADLVERRFAADAPCRLWVADITYVRTSWIPAVVATPAARSGDAGEEVHGAAAVGVPGVDRSGRIGAGSCSGRRCESGSRLPMDEAGGAVDAAEHAA
jgi:hypothetical protein